MNQEILFNFYNDVAEELNKRGSYQDPVFYETDELLSLLVENKADRISLDGTLKEEFVLNLKGKDREVFVKEISAACCESIEESGSNHFIKRDPQEGNSEIQVGNVVLYFRKFYSVIWKEYKTSFDIYVEK